MATTMPRPASLLDTLQAVQADMRRAGVRPGEATDIRLQVHENGQWQLHWGDPSFDLDHRGYWGADSIEVDDCPGALRDLAERLVDDAADMMAQGEE